MHSGIATLVLLQAMTFVQPPDDEGKVSNDQPGRPLQMPPASTEVKEALDDFERFRRRGAWERALKALFTIPEEQTLRFVDGEKGFIVPVARRRRSVLAALPPEGQAAYRLFYDAEARKLFDEAEGPNEQKNLERVYSAYFLSSVGDDAADRLGDLYFEMGRFDRAADCWLAVLHDRPDTDLPPGRLSVKAALALSHAGRRSELEQVRADLTGRYADEKVTLAGETGPPSEVLRRLLGKETPATETPKPSSTSPGSSPKLAAQVDPVWQMRFAESIEAGMTPAELTQWESNTFGAVVPAVAVEGTRLFANYLGYEFALDLKSGKMLWRSAAFHHIEIPAMQQQAQMIDPSRFAVVAQGEYVWSLGRDLKDQNWMAPFVLTCRRADGGEVIWKSSDLTDYAALDLVGTPLLAGGKLFVVGKTGANPQQQQQGQPGQVVLAIQPHDGKVLWKTEVGTSRQGQQQYFFYGMRETSAQPQLLFHAGTIYVDTHVGVLARLDAESGTLDWGYGYETDPAQGGGRFFFFRFQQQSESSTASSLPLQVGESILIKGAASGHLCSLEPNRMQVLWDRPIEKSTRLLGASGSVVFLGGAELSAMDLQTRKLLWATRLPGGSEERRVLVRDDGLWQLTSRGVFEIDPKDGAVRRIFRGSDLGSAGGDLFVTDRLLIAVSNRTVTAYPRRGKGADVSALADPAGTTKRASND